MINCLHSVKKVLLFVMKLSIISSVGDDICTGRVTRSSQKKISLLVTGGNKMSLKILTLHFKIYSNEIMNVNTLLLEV